MSKIQSNYRGNWLTGATYNTGDIVTFSGYVVTCQTPHTAGTFATDVQFGYWQMTNPMKNYLINGNFDFAQRGSVSSPSSFQYLLDRWHAFQSNSTTTISQQTSSPPAGSLNYMQVAFGATNAFVGVAQAIEQVNLIPIVSKTVTFTCLLRMTAGFTNDLIISIDYNTSANTASGGTWAAVNNLTIHNASLSTTNWYKATVTAVVPSNALGLRCTVNVTSGTTTNGTDYQVAQAMLNEGPAPALFQTAGISTAEELVLCQRYYEKSYDIGVNPGTNGAAGYDWFWSPLTISNAQFKMIPFKVSKRTAPGAIIVYSIDGTANKIRNASTGTNEGGSTSNVTATGFLVVYTTVTNNLGDQQSAAYHWTADAEL